MEWNHLEMEMEMEMEVSGNGNEGVSGNGNGGVSGNGNGNGNGNPSGNGLIGVNEPPRGGRCDAPVGSVRTVGDLIFAINQCHEHSSKIQIQQQQNQQM